MKTQLKHSILAFTLFIGPWALQAQESDYQGGDWRKHITLSLGLDALRSNAEFSGGNNTVSLSSDPKWGYGVMTAVELGLADYAGIALGAHYLHRRFQISGSGVNLTRTIPTVFFPLEARFYLLKILSLGAGGFAAVPVGKTSDSYSVGDTTVVNTGSSRNGVDYGLTGALGVNLPLGPLGVFGEVRYNYGLSDSASNGDVEEKIRDLLFTVGVKVKI